MTETQERQESAAIEVAAPTNGALALPAHPIRWSADQIAVMQRTICSELTPGELKLLLYRAQALSLDPLAGQIFGIPRGQGSDRKLTIQVGIEGLRLISRRTGLDAGKTAPEWCGADGCWLDFWPFDYPPLAARVGVRIVGQEHITWGVAHYREYVQRDRSGKVVAMWERMPANQLAKCAEAQARRAAFPAELAGIYCPEEMPVIDVTIVEEGRQALPAPRPATRPAASTAVSGCSGCGDRISPAVAKFSTEKWGRVLCLSCQQAAKDQGQAPPAVEQANA